MPSEELLTLSPAPPAPARLRPIELIGRSAAIARVNELLRRSAALDSGGVLITAEPGAGVESVARDLHDRGRGAAGPFVAIACAADAGAGLDRLLFGAAPADSPMDLEPVSTDSRLAAARGGTLFLQDVTELPAAVQARLARVARDGEMRLDKVAVASALRLVASAPPGIDADVRAHRFRPELFRRLTTVRIDLPPLRERLEDVPPLATRILEDLCAASGRTRTFTDAALALLAALTWPGNLAELQNVIERAVAATRDEVIRIEHLLPALDLHRARTTVAPSASLREARLRFERDYIAAVLQRHGWRMAEAARVLGIQRPNLYRKARQLGIPLARVSE